MRPSVAVGFFILAFGNVAFCVELWDVIMEDGPNVAEQVRNILAEERETVSKEVLEKGIAAAAIKKNENLAEFLINYAADAVPGMKFGAKSLNWIIMHKLESAFSLIMETKNVDFLQQEEGRTCLHQAASSGNMSMLETLLARKPEIDVVLNWNCLSGFGTPERTALHFVARSRIEEPVSSAMAEALLMAGAEHSPKDSDGYTPLHYCAMYHNVECAEVLVKYGALYDAKDSWGRKPIYYPLKNGHKDMVIILEEYGRRTDEVEYENSCLRKVKLAEEKYIQSLEDEAKKANEKGKYAFPKFLFRRL